MVSLSLPKKTIRASRHAHQILLSKNRPAQFKGSKRVDSELAEAGIIFYFDYDPALEPN